MSSGSYQSPTGLWKPWIVALLHIATYFSRYTQFKFPEIQIIHISIVITLHFNYIGDMLRTYQRDAMSEDLISDSCHHAILS